MLLVGFASADIIFIGDAAAEGTAVSNGTNAFSVEQLTIVNLSDGSVNAPVLYTAPEDQDIELTQVNFFSEAAGNLTPFIVRIVGADAQGAFDGQLASSYEVLAIGDSINAAPSSLINGSFAVNGSSPIVSLSDGDSIAAGFLTDTARLVSNNAGIPQGGTDYIFSGDSITGAAIGSPLTANSTFGTFDRPLSFNIGFVVVPEPSSAMLLVGIALPFMCRRRRN